MNQLPSNRNTNREDSFFERTAIVLLDVEQWSYLQKRYHITPRELQVARLVCRGFNNDEIAEVLKIRQGTVKSHLRNVYRKVRVKSKITLLLRFVEDVNRFYLPFKPASSRIPIADRGSKAHITPIIRQKN